MADLLENQIRAAIVLENGMVALIDIINRMSEAYAKGSCTKEQVKEELKLFMGTCIEYGQLRQYHENTLANE